MRFTSTFYKSEDVFVPLNRKENLAAAANFVCNLHNGGQANSTNDMFWADTRSSRGCSKIPEILGRESNLFYLGEFLRDFASDRQVRRPSVESYSRRWRLLM